MPTDRTETYLDGVVRLAGGRDPLPGLGSVSAAAAVFILPIGIAFWAIAELHQSDRKAADGAFSISLWMAFCVVLAATIIAARLLTMRDRRVMSILQHEKDRAETFARQISAQTSLGAEYQRVKEAAELANEAKTKYLVAVSHEIRSPLNAICGYAQLLERSDAISGAEAGAVIRRSADHLTNLVEGLLEISRIESGVIKLRSDIIDLPALLSDVVDMFRMEAAAKGLQLTFAVEGRLPAYVKTDEKRLRQILINVISNAVKYTREGAVTVMIGYRSQVANIEVRDTGIGIRDSDLERIFQPFERGDDADVKYQPGIGLGLPITRALVRILGGDMTVTSTLGVGSSFRIRILLPEPAVPPPDAPRSGERIVGYEGQQRTILVVDDDPAQGTVLQTLLRSLGFAVLVAETGEAGIALAGQHAVDLCLLDIQLPGASGWKTAGLLRADHGSALPIVMVSANAYEFQPGGDGNSLHNAFITKPVDFDALLAVICHQLQLTWRRERTPPPVAVGSTANALPEAAAPFVATLRQLARVGHVRGIEGALDEFGAAVPEASPLVATLRRHAGAFDLRSLVKTLDDAEPR